MGTIAVFASGGGSNFGAIVNALKTTRHEIAVLVCDKPTAYARQRAAAAGIPVEDIRYTRDVPREEVEKDLLLRLEAYAPDLIVFAGFMRIVSPLFVDAYKGRILNIHPSLLPKYPGTRGIEESYASGDSETGVSIHIVDQGIDTGPMLRQEKIPRIEGESLPEFEERIHALEHRLYPEVILDILDKLS